MTLIELLSICDHSRPYYINPIHILHVMYAYRSNIRINKRINWNITTNLARRLNDFN